MFELGKYAVTAHQKIINQLESTDLESILTVGEHFLKTQSHDPRVLAFHTLDEIINYITQNPFVDTEILIKGSRGMTMEKLLDYL